MDINKISENEMKILFKAADEYQTNGTIQELCPRCNGKLKYIGNMSSYRIYCERECGILLNIRGI